MNNVVLTNPKAGTGLSDEMKKALAAELEGETAFEDVTELNGDLQHFIDGLGKDVRIVVAGGDGTLNRFVNDVDCDKLVNEVLLCPAGSGNDFYKDLAQRSAEYFPEIQPPVKEEERRLLPINRFLKNLPTVTVNGKTYKFVNGIGYGIDGYCCEVGDKLKAENKKVNYTSIAIKGLLFHFKPKNATVTVDGQKHYFKKTWIAPAMKGRYYGGGMMPTPAQDRTKEGTLSLCVMYGKGKIATLMAFPSIFKGEHVKKEKMVKILEGREITVEFDAPCALQIDGETVLGVTSYTAKV